MRPLLCSVLSAAERRTTRDLTLAQLTAAGLKPVVSLNTPTHENAAIADKEADHLKSAGYRVWITGDPEKGYGGHNNIAGGRPAFFEAFETGSDLLYCEDDIDLAHDFLWFLGEARAVRDAVTYFYTHDGRGDKQLGARYGLHVWRSLKRCMYYREPFPPGLYRVRDTTKLNSGQAILFPHEVLQLLPLDELNHSHSAVDMWTQSRVTKVGVPILVALPHPVQHRHDRTGRQPSVNPNKTSQSFDLRPGRG
jgi:hypothetical protein